MNELMDQYELAPWVADAWTAARPYLPMVAGALGILVGGWIVAALVKRLVFSGLKKTSIDDKLAEALGFEQDENHRIERGVAKGVYYLIWALVIVALLDFLALDLVTQPLVTALGGIASAIPSVMKAMVIAAVGLLLAIALRKLTVTLVEKTKIVGWVQSLGEEPDQTIQSEQPSTAPETIGRVVFYAVLVLTSVPVLDALRVGVLAGPLSAALGIVTTYLPRIVAAGIILFAGYVLARLARTIILAVVRRIGLDEWLASWGLSQVLGSSSSGSILGTIAFVFILLHFAISAMGRLGIPEISEPLGLLLVQVYDYLPRILVAALILAIGVFLGRFVARLSSNLFAALGFNGFAVHIGLVKETEESKAQQERGKSLLKGSDSGARSEQARSLMVESRSARTPSDVAGTVLGAALVLLFAQQALQTLHLTSLSRMLSALLGYTPQLLVAVVVLAVGIWAGSWVKSRIDDLTQGSKDALFRSLGSLARITVLALSVMVAMQQLGVASQLVAIAFALLLGAVCVALALAFGLGGREVASEILREAYQKRKH